VKEIGNSIGRRAPDNTHTRVAAAYLVGRSVDTLKRWHKQGLCVPSQSMQAGKLRVWLYTDDDMMKLREVARKQKPGRKKIVKEQV
jgi:DNA-binding transcriptional MerR regulator